MARARGLRGPGPVGTPPLRAGPAGARLRLPDCLFIYFRGVLLVAMATAPSFPASLGHRCFQTFLGQGLLRSCSFGACGNPARIRALYSSPLCRDDPFFLAWESSSLFPLTCHRQVTHPPNFLDSAISSPLFPQRRSHSLTTAPSSLHVALLLARNGNPLFPAGFPGHRYLVYCGPLGFRIPSSVNTSISRPSRSVYVPLCFLFITTKNPLETIQSWPNQERVPSLSRPG